MTDEPSPIPERRRTTLWLTSSLAVAALAAWSLWHLPPAARKPVLFGLAWGSLAGMALGHWGGRCGVSRRWAGTAAVLVAPLTLAGIHVGWAQDYAAASRRAETQLVERMQNDPLASAAEDFATARPADDAEARALREELTRSAQIYEARRAQFRAGQTFPGYLHDRINRAGRDPRARGDGAFGVWPAPWPALFWILELAAASVLAGWLADREVRLARGDS